MTKQSKIEKFDFPKINWINSKIKHICDDNQMIFINLLYYMTSVNLLRLQSVQSFSSDGMKIMLINLNKIMW